MTLQEYLNLKNGTDVRGVALNGVEGEPLTYGIIQILQLPDDSATFVTNPDTGKQYIDQTLAEDLFLKPVYLNIKCQMVVAK